MEKYILEELNVRSLVLTSDKQKYGVALRAEPDHKTLGARLKGAFKTVTPAIKALTDKEIQKFLSEGKYDVLGHTLELTDIRIMFSFTGPAAKELSEKYEAHSDNDVLILLDVTQNEGMMEEGIAREVINRVQKLRKRAHMNVSDPATVYYEVSPKGNALSNIIQKYLDMIESTVKGPLRPAEKSPRNCVKIAEEMSKIKEADLKLVAVKGFCEGFAGASGDASPIMETACK